MTNIKSSSDYMESNGIRIGHFLVRVIEGVLIAFALFIIVSKVVDPGGSNAGKVLVTSDLQKYMFSFIVIYGILSLAIVSLLFYIKRFRISAIVVLIFLIFGSICGAAVVLYDTPSSLRYDSLAMSNKCVAIVSTENGHGTGFSTKSGYLISNYHVIENAKNISIHYSTDNNASIVGFSKEMDIVILKTNENIPTCRWADSSKIKVGSELFATGWPRNKYGSPTTTKGIYSRTITQSEAVNVLGLPKNEYIQTDAAINPGNSGGPLSNDEGIVGINTAKPASVSSPEGISYAISSNSASTYIKSIIGE